MPGNTSYHISKHQYNLISNFNDIEKSTIYDAFMNVALAS